MFWWKAPFGAFHRRRVDSHFSDVKDVYHAEWNRLDPAATVKTILQEYRKKKGKIEHYVDIKEPKLWSM
jgi:hypothetical protein